MPIPASRRHFLQLTSLALATAPWSQGPAWAAEPPRLARIILGVPAGSLVDNIARQVAEILQPGYAANAYVENKTGAGGILAVRYITSQPADGQSIYVGVSSPLTVYPATYKDLPYDVEKDLIPICSLGTFDLALAVGPMVPESVRTLQQYFDWCKANPEKATFGSPGEGSMLHFLGSMTGRAAGVDLMHVPYRGPGPAVLDLAGANLSAAVVPLSDLVELANAGKIRILGTTGERRSRFVPDVPTFAEQGYGDYAMNVWIAVFAAAGTPQPLIDRLRDTLQQGLADPRVQQGMGAQLQEVKWGDEAYLRDRIRREQASWQKAVGELQFSRES